MDMVDTTAPYRLARPRTGHMETVDPTAPYWHARPRIGHMEAADSTAPYRHARPGDSVQNLAMWGIMLIALMMIHLIDLLGVNHTCIDVNKMDCDTAVCEQSNRDEIANEVTSMLVKVGWKKDSIVDTAYGGFDMLCRLPERPSSALTQF